jgi:hypothetical protein
MDKTYLNPDVHPEYNHNRFWLLDVNGVVVSKHEPRICFGDIFQYSIPDNVESILVFKNKTKVPYDEDAIVRWIDDISTMGFPCAFLGGNDYDYIWQLLVQDFDNKPQMMSVLSLIRLLYETNGCKIPQIYFQMIDKDPDIDRFEALQIAHKKMDAYYIDTDHLVTSVHIPKNIKPEVLFERYRKNNHPTKEKGERKYRPTLISTHWKG